MNYVVKMKKIIAFIIIGVLFINLSSAVTKTELRDFLKTELTKYFEEGESLLSAQELRDLFNVYSSLTSEDAKLSENGIPQSVINIVEGSNKVSDENAESFSCTITTTAIETWNEKTDVQKKGVKDNCCYKKKVIWFSASCSKKEDSPCVEKGKYSKNDICKKTLGEGWSPLGTLVNNLKSCTYSEAQEKEKSETRTTTQSITNNVKTEEVKNLGIIKLPSKMNNGELSSIEYDVESNNLKVSCFEKDGVLFAKLK